MAGKKPIDFGMKWKRTGKPDDAGMSREQPIPSPPYLADSPAVDDRFGFRAQVLAKQILAGSVPLTDGFSIGVLGDWGAGKTSFLRQLKHELTHPEDKDTPTPRVVWFSPWEYRHEPNLMVPLMLKLMGPDAELRKKLVRVLAAMNVALVDTVTRGWVTRSRELEKEYTKRLKLSEYHELREFFEQVVAQAASDRKFLVVLVDDLDRVTPGEKVLHLMEGIRNFLMLKNCLVVIAVDEQALTRIVTEQLGAAAPRYLEKFFNLRVHLPRPRPDQLTTLLNQSDGDLSVADGLRCYLEQVAGMARLNGRQYKRLVNGFLWHRARLRISQHDGELAHKLLKYLFYREVLNVANPLKEIPAIQDAIRNRTCPESELDEHLLAFLFHDRKRELARHDLVRFMYSSGDAAGGDGLGLAIAQEMRRHLADRDILDLDEWNGGPPDGASVPEPVQIRNLAVRGGTTIRNGRLHDLELNGPLSESGGLTFENVSFETVTFRDCALADVRFAQCRFTSCKLLRVQLDGVVWEYEDRSDLKGLSLEETSGLRDVTVRHVSADKDLETDAAGAVWLLERALAAVEACADAAEKRGFLNDNGVTEGVLDGWVRRTLADGDLSRIASEYANLLKNVLKTRDETEA